MAAGPPMCMWVLLHSTEENTHIYSLVTSLEQYLFEEVQNQTRLDTVPLKYSLSLRLFS